MASESLRSVVDEWLSLDKNVESRKFVQGLLLSGKLQELEALMRPRIEFGTAGLRGRMEPGFARMNDLIIVQASQGLCAYSMKTVPDAKTKGVVIGHDHRHNSARWARLAASAFIAGGMKVYLHRDLVHTPLVPFSVKKLGAACGVMITASHNPKQDNGYKVYWENCVQIIGPHDTGIAASILENLNPVSWKTDEETDKILSTSDLCVDRTAEMFKAYYALLGSICTSKLKNSASSLKFVNTSMHGVSHPIAARAFEIFGFRPFVPVKEQMEPDTDFPTVKFPNPEEKGALDLALQTAEKEGANYVLAQDPDADRFSAAERSANGEWTTFTGDQLGALFAAQALESYKACGQPMEKLAMVASTVSSKMVEAMAEKEGFKFVECLTGFKFIGNTALTLVGQGYYVPFGYEEAIGFMFGDEIRDKDGVAASVKFAELAASLHDKGQSVKSYLEELYARYGYFQTSNSYFICSSPSTVDAIFARIRNYPKIETSSASEGFKGYPRTIAGLIVTRVVDLTKSCGYDSANAPTFSPSLPLSSGHMIQFRAEAPDGDSKIVLTTRTSGTEPKIKYYLEGSGSNATQVSELLPKVVAELRNSWMEAEKHHLGRP